MLGCCSASVLLEAPVLKNGDEAQSLLSAALRVCGAIMQSTGRACRKAGYFYSYVASVSKSAWLRRVVATTFDS